MTVLQRYLLDRRRSTLWWILAAVGLVLFTVAFYPSIKGQQGVDQVVQDLPEAFRALIGAQQGISFTSAPGYLHARLFSTVVPIVLLVMGISAGSYAIGGSEDDGTLEALLANPVSRRRVVFERYGAMVLLLAILVISFAAALLMLGPLFSALDGITVAHVLGACAAAGALGLLHGSLAFAVGGVAGRRAPAIALSAALAIGGYLAYGLLTAANVSRAFMYLSPWYWYLQRNMLVEGTARVSLILPLLLSALFLVVAWLAFERRDLH